MDKAIGKYCSVLLLDKGQKLSSDEKYVLIQVLFHFGMDVVVKKTVKELVRLFGMSEAVYRKNRDSLIHKGLLVECRRSISGKGRMRKGLAFSASYLVELKELSAKYSERKYEHLIHELLNPNGYWRLGDINLKVDLISEEEQLHKNGESYTGLKLRPSVRIFMCILLAHSDLTGVVDGLGHADIKALTDMKRDGVVSQLSKLKDIGFLRGSISGLTGAGLFGVVKSEYLIDLAWCGFKEKVQPAVVSIFTPRPSSNQPIDEASGIFNQARRITDVDIDRGNVKEVAIRAFIHRSTPPIDSIPIFKLSPNLASYILDGNGLNIEKMLQWRIERYASKILSENWTKVNPKGIPDTFYQNAVITLGKQGDVGGDEKLLAFLMCEISYSIAKFIRSILFDLEKSLNRQKLRFQNMNHLLLPKVSDRDLMSFCLLSYPKRTRAEEAIYVMLENDKEKPNKRLMKKVDYADIPPEVISKYCL